MPKFAANLTMLFQELPFLERFGAASEAGFQFIEYLFPYDYSIHELQTQLTTHNLSQVLFNLPPGNWSAGERGIACLPDRVSEFREGLEQAITYAKALDVKQINCLAGLRPTHASESELWQTLCKNVDYAARQFALHDLTLLVEPINSRVDMPGFYLDTFDKARQLLDAVNQPNLRLQFDLYHMQIMHGDLIRTLNAHLDQIAHIQFADNPGRHEPGTGELNFDTIFSTLDSLGYRGFVSAEYLPAGTTRDSLAWLRTFN